ncbi:hypothetical protein LTR78_009071 [Recurvomyces mirabilis]|uniref:Uncharacterized protein n=1 Tax=Recurvomyces mirabilis TaxID=574656 RepID=A0AAE0WIL8_9PEZI|nr:hypothetical protein LTR78_009071 [Recurvomyces mirabilis]KAK5150400.1 hypothetical protein LTS14_010090 [Recurvomyces mirabilis]
MDYPRLSLLGLPRELRNHILAYLVFASRNEPISPLFPDKRTKGPQGIMLPSNTALSRRSRIPNINHQLREEIQQQVDTLYKTGNAITEVDVMVKGYLLWPTWTKQPIILQRGKSADMNMKLRIFSTESLQPRNTWPGTAGAGLCGLYTLLNMFLRYGTSTAWSHPAAGFEQEAYCIDTLTIKVIFVDIYTPDTWPGTIAEIVAKLKVFATAGIPYPYVRKLRLECDYLRRDEQVLVTSQWEVKERTELVSLNEWDDACVLFYGRQGP